MLCAWLFCYIYMYTNKSTKVTDMHMCTAPTPAAIVQYISVTNRACKYIQHILLTHTRMRSCKRRVDGVSDSMHIGSVIVSIIQMTLGMRMSVSISSSSCIYKFIHIRVCVFVNVFDLVCEQLKRVFIADIPCTHIHMYIHMHVHVYVRRWGKLS